ncbi:MAG: BlaI/MecI/CopY family transcriptional regulator [Planctomycetaceae bacterium]
MAKRPEPLGPAQLEVLQYVADHHPVRVGQVAEHFARTAGKARTTILTVMERLREKGYLTRTKLQGTYHYSPRQTKSDLLAGVVRRFVEESLGGSVSPFIAYLADARGLSEDEVDKLKALVRDLAKSRNEKRR